MCDSEIIVCISGGVLQQVKFGSAVPKCISVRVWDYDNEGAAEGELSRDDEGNPCSEGVWANE